MYAEEKKKDYPLIILTRLPGAVPQPLFLLFIVSGCITFFEVVFHFQKNWGRLPLKKLRSSSIFKNIEVVFHISSSWVRISLHTKNQLSRLPGSGLNVMIPGGGVVVVWWWWCGGFFTDYNTTPTKLFCFVLCCWLCCGNYNSPDEAKWETDGSSMKHKFGFKAALKGAQRCSQWNLQRSTKQFKDHFAKSQY